MVFRWAVLGTPNKAREIFYKITASGKHKAVAAFSDDEKELKKFVAAFSAKPCASIKEAIEDERVDGVFIALPVTYRYAVTLEVIKAGKPVFSLPSATVNDTQIKKAMATAMEYNVFYGVADVGRYFGLVEDCERLIYSDLLGEITEIKGVAYASVERSRALEPNRRSGAILSAAPYMFSLMDIFLGYPKNVKCRDLRVQHGVDLTDKIEMNYDVATCRIVCTVRKWGANRIKLFGRFGTMSVKINRDVCTVKIKVTNGHTQIRKETNGYVTMFDKAVKDILHGTSRMSENLNWSSMVDIARMEDACRQKIGLFYATNIESTLPKALPERTASKMNGKEKTTKKKHR